MPVRISSFRPTTQERVEELRRTKIRRTGDPVMAELLDAVEAGEPQDVTLEPGQNARGVRIAIARAAGRRGFAVETFEWSDEEGTPFVTIAKAESHPSQPRAHPAPPGASDGQPRRRGRPRKQAPEPVRGDGEDAFAVEEAV